MIKAAIFDRDGVLTDFDHATLKAFFEPRLPFGVAALMQRWWQWRVVVGYPSDLEEEKLVLKGFWDTLAAELGLPDALRDELHRFDYTDAIVAYAETHASLRLARQ